IFGTAGCPFMLPRAPAAVQPVAGLMLQMCLGAVQAGACCPLLVLVKVTVLLVHTVSLGASVKPATGDSETRIWPMAPVRVSHGLVIRQAMANSPPATA